MQTATLVTDNRICPLIIAGCFFGLGEAFVTSSSAAMVADYCKAQHYGAAMGTFGTVFDVGHASGPIVTVLCKCCRCTGRFSPFISHDCQGRTELGNPVIFSRNLQ